MKGSRGLIAISINSAWNVANFRGGLIAGLVGEGFDVVSIAPPDRYANQVEAMGSRFIPLPMDSKGINPINDIALYMSYCAILKKERPVAFLGYTIKPNIYGSLAAQSLSIPTINNVSGLGTSFIRKTWLTRLVKEFYRKAFAESQCVFFQNREDLDLFISEGIVAEGQAGLVPGSGINLEHFAPADREPETNAGDCCFLLIARLVYDKGVREYVDAARIVREMRPNTRFKILGFLDVENRTAVSRDVMAKWLQEGVIEYLGHADDVRPYISVADCIVLPSYREGVPRSLLEAAAMAKPVIASNVAGCRAVVEDGKNGLLCEVQSTGDLVQKMLEMIDIGGSKRRQMGLAGRMKIEREFDEGIVIDAYLRELGKCKPVVR